MFERIGRNIVFDELKTQHKLKLDLRHPLKICTIRLFPARQAAKNEQ